MAQMIIERIYYISLYFCYAFSEADLENFISNLFHQAMQTDGGTSQNWQQPQQTPNGQAWNSASHPSTGAAGGGKKSRRRKKKH